jgi:CDP-6-deoxy-D-xylo-4-hexulose-3-dehydrase
MIAMSGLGTAGCIFMPAGNTAGMPLLALGEPDAEGEVRCLRHSGTAGAQAAGVLTVGAADLADDPDCEAGGSEPLRFDAAKPVYVSTGTLGVKMARITPAALAKVHRSLVQQEVTRFGSYAFQAQPFEPGITPIPAAGKVVGTPEVQHMVDAAMDAWLTTGRFNQAFEAGLAKFLGVDHVLTTNSGSSSNLLALSALTSPALGDRALRPGDEVVSVAAGFPTTINPIVQNGLTPVFFDVDVATLNIDAALIEAAITPRTRAIMLAHTLGNPYNLAEIVRLKEKYGLWLIEDCCDALGATYQGRKVGTFGDIGTLSFYPAHHITMGEGGAVFTKDALLRRILESFRDWGRDCYCAPGKDNTCGKRFGWQLGSLPQGYDHKYTYSHVGYNLKITDMQAAAGLAQLERLPGFIAARRRNFGYLKTRLKDLEEFFVMPEATPHSEPSWFGFPLTLRDSASVQRVDLLRYLDQYKIGTRLLFAGNVTRQPYFSKVKYRIAGDLSRTDTVMNNTLWIGLFPGLTDDMLDYTATRMSAFFGGGF